MWWIIKLKIYVVLTGMANPHYIKTQEINKEKIPIELTDFSEREQRLPISWRRYSGCLSSNNKELMAKGV